MHCLKKLSSFHHSWNRLRDLRHKNRYDVYQVWPAFKVFYLGDTKHFLNINRILYQTIGPIHELNVSKYILKHIYESTEHVNQNIIS